MAARTKRKKPVKGEIINVRCTDAQKQTLKEAAERVGLGVSPWLLTLGLREAAKMSDPGAVDSRALGRG